MAAKDAPFVSTSIHARKKLVQRSHVDVALVPVSLRSNAEPVELVECLHSRPVLVARPILHHALEGQSLTTEFPSLQKRHDVRLKTREDCVRHDLAEPCVDPCGEPVGVNLQISDTEDKPVP